MVERVYPQMHFLLEIGGVTKAGFSRCDLPAATSRVIEYREGNERTTPRKLPGLNRYGPLVLETGLTEQSFELYEWRSLVEQGNIADARRSAAVNLLDASGTAVARWTFTAAWPSRYEAPRLSATTEQVAIERLVIEHEGFERIDLEPAEDDEDAEEKEVPKADQFRGLEKPQGTERFRGTKPRPTDTDDTESAEP